MHNNTGSYEEDRMLTNKDVNKARFKIWICKSFKRKETLLSGLKNTVNVNMTAWLQENCTMHL